MINEENGPIDKDTQKRGQGTRRAKANHKTLNNMKKVLQGLPPIEPTTEETSVKPKEKRHTEEVVNKILGIRPQQKAAESEQVKTPQFETGGNKGIEQQASDIPQFDLAEQIMAEQRKVSGLKRKRPADKLLEKASQPKTLEPRRSQLTSTLQHKILTEIVARDIQLLTRF